MILKKEQIAQFRLGVWSYYHDNGRSDLPWRQPENNNVFDPYKILVSEIMLQQTQVSRVVPKYIEFLNEFPTVEVLAGATLGDVLRAWQGLGYNRRAKYLLQAAQYLARRESFPKNETELVQLPGVGVNTSRAIQAYAFNQPTFFVETNIRTVYMYHFAPGKDSVSDKFIQNLVSQTLDAERPREFYWALMDYGTYLKTKIKNNTQSKHYTKQSKFEGSRRQIRGRVLKELADFPIKIETLRLKLDDDRLDSVLEDLVREGMIIKTENKYHLA